MNDCQTIWIDCRDKINSFMYNAGQYSYMQNTVPIEKVFDNDGIVIVARDRGYYVFTVSEDNARWSEDKPTQYADHSEFVSLPDAESVEEVFETAQDLAIDKGVSLCKLCRDEVPVGRLQRQPYDYVSTVCGECLGNCSNCGSENISRFRPTTASSRERSGFECNECGHYERQFSTG